MLCPQCRSGDCARSRRNGFRDYLLAWAGIKPWRCLTCEKRFYAGKVAVPFARFVHCPRCGNFNLQVIARIHVERGTLVYLKRFLGFPAYRCDTCRERFFSILRYRPILPSLVPSVMERSTRN